MKFVLIFGVLMSLLFNVLGYTYFVPPPKNGVNAAGQKICNFSGLSLAPGATALLGEGRCEKVFCNDDLSINIHGCGTFHIEDPACRKFIRDHSKPYPDCCNTFICVDKVSDPSLSTLESQTEIGTNALD